MNLYDSKVINCEICQIQIGEIDLECKVSCPRCQKCSKKLPLKVQLVMGKSLPTPFPHSNFGAPRNSIA